MIIEVGESSNTTQEVSYKSLHESSRVNISLFFYLQFLRYNDDT